MAKKIENFFGSVIKIPGLILSPSRISVVQKSTQMIFFVVLKLSYYINRENKQIQAKNRKLLSILAKKIENFFGSVIKNLNADFTTEPELGCSKVAKYESFEGFKFFDHKTCKTGLFIANFINLFLIIRLRHRVGYICSVELIFQLTENFWRMVRSIRQRRL